MTIQEKLQIIQKVTGLTQTKLAERFGVSFVAFSNWWTGKSKPRAKVLNLIDELYLDVTGQKTIPEDILTSKKQIILSLSKQHKNLVEEIIKNKDIYNEFVLKLTYHSNGIEGSTLSEADTAAIIFDNVALSNKTLIEQIEAKNHQTAVDYLFSYLVKKGRIDEKLILKLHSILMNGIYSDAGSYRRHSVRITGSNVPTANYIKVPDLMKKLFVNIKRKNTDLIKQISVIHSQFEQIHPFPDGNGRTGRLLMTAMLLKGNIAPAVIHKENKQLYYSYLNKSQLKEDFSQLEGFVCDAITEGFEILERKTI